MKILLLVILFSQHFSGMHNVPVVKKVVASPEQAAVLLYEQEQTLWGPEPGGLSAHLYRIDVDLGMGMVTVQEVDIPRIRFEHKKKGRQ